MKRGSLSRLWGNGGGCDLLYWWKWEHSRERLSCSAHSVHPRTALQLQIHAWGLCREGLCLQPAEHRSRYEHRGTRTVLAWTRLKGCLWPLGQVCSEQACGDASAQINAIDGPEGHHGTAGITWGWRHRLFAEDLGQQFQFPSSQSSYTAARYVPATPNSFPPFQTEYIVPQQH